MKGKYSIIYVLLSLVAISCGGLDDFFDDEQDIIYVANDSINNPSDSISQGTANNDTTVTKTTAKKLSIARKRAEQFLEIKWENLLDLPSTTSHSGIKAGTHKGMPYSSVKECNKFIGYDASIKTFMTALHNKYSLIYTEDVLKSRSQSAYGFHYNGINCGSYYGTVCSFFVAYVLDLNVPYVTAEYDYLYRLGIFDKPEDQSINTLQVMDVIWEPGHASIIIDIERDENDSITHVIWAESVPSFVKSTKMTPNQFTTRLKNKKGIIYRYKNMNNLTNYTPSEFVAVGDEAPVSYTYNDDICTFAGDYACFNEKDKIILNYEKQAYNKIELIKNNKFFSYIDLPNDPNQHSIDIQNQHLTYGKYKARLISDNKVSDYTCFEVVQTNVTYESQGDLKKISFSSANAKPLYIQFFYCNGEGAGKYIFTEKDISNGYIVTNPKSTFKKVFNKSSWDDTVYLKVFFQGEYGRVTNPIIETDLR